MEALAVSTAASFLSEVGHGTSYKIAGQTLLLLESAVESKTFHPDTRQRLDEMDLSASISTVKAMLCDLEPVLSKSGLAMNICFKNLGDCVEVIQKELVVMELKCKKHNDSYYSYLYSSPNLKKEMDTIERMKHVLDYRIDLAAKSAEIYLQIDKFHKLTDYQYKESSVTCASQEDLCEELVDRKEYVFVEKVL